MKKVLTIFAMFSVILLSGFANNASAQSSSVEEVTNQVGSVVEVKSIYDNAKVLKEFEKATGKTDRYSTTHYYKVKYDYISSTATLKFFLSSDHYNHELYVYDENYLSVGKKNTWNNDVIVENPETYAWYYIEVRQVGPNSWSESPYILSHGW
ncbi:hypothetical protein [Sporosarcina psychrophila]|uniref:Protein involved in sex pheromone biosynthesis n=1 Tax=Sporosarcina psychrophila TaxID=1476 RepID=A0ABV2KB59_SPOPS